MVTLTTWPSGLSRLVYLPSMDWGSIWLGNLSPVYANSWIGLISIKGLRRTNSKARENVRLSLRRGGNLGRIITTITEPEGILLDNLGLQLLRQLTRCFEKKCIKSWRRPRTSHTSDGQKRWEETPWGVIRAFIANTIRSRGIPLRTAELYGTIWSN